MERLSEQLKTVEKLVKDGIAIGDSMELTEDCVKILQDAAQLLAHYEDLEEQGRLIILGQMKDGAMETEDDLISGSDFYESISASEIEAALAASGKEG